ncbi:MAG: hypothetical protein ACO3O7_01860 [Ilumatobacteraceae bacterium]|jgi:hypothetical protein
MRRVLAIACFSLALASCATTIVETSPTTTVTPSTTTIPSGSTTELVAELQDRLDQLSIATFAQDKPKAKSILSDIEAVWLALEPKATSEGEQFVADLTRIIDLARTSVVRNRPAEADKAARFMQLLVDSSS